MAPTNTDVLVMGVSFSSQLTTYVGDCIDGHPLWTAQFLVSNPEAIYQTHLDILKAQIVICEAGTIQQLSSYVGGDDCMNSSPLWSAQFLKTNPDAIYNAHLDVLRAGADLILTNTYQATVDGFIKYMNLSREESIQLIKDGVILANKAVDKFMEGSNPNIPRPFVVGTVGPYGAAQHDGSEYTGKYHDQVTNEYLRGWHVPRIEALIDAGCKYLHFGTIPCLTEAEVLIELMKKYPDIKFSLTFSCRPDGRSLSSGENFQEAIHKCYDMNPNQLLALGVNCIQPIYIEPLIKGINDSRGDKPIPLMIFPNSGEIYDSKRGWIGKEECKPLAEYVKLWLNLGVTWIGGCCRTTARDVTRIREQALEWKNERSST